ncbi:hypothetical protein HC251_14100 [Iamia sp. SCSIO 61187]|uniref:restriction endonuclease subunit S n=1 Tax=Iamia sp. SCSIO 61187 TaxID=2722752 RepID=UPI001C6320D8|nr:restriction endonuclease subunit S [Iamia sp. SCSIO 61187]QYG93442.1 hypothetical protein HC251_14100 [Iamia sp. SCSIO 61187]
MSELPPGWEWTTLGEIGRYLNGRGFKKSEWSDSGRPIIRIQNLTGSGAAFNYYEGQADERHTVHDGDLLVSWAATLGVYVWRGPEAVLNQHIFKVESRIRPGFHRWLLDNALADLQRQTHGSGMVHITKGRFDSTPVPLPPLSEQERIVAAIEEHLSRLDAAEDGVNSAHRRTGTLVQRLIDSTWDRAETVALADLLEQPLANGRSVRTDPDGFPVLRLTALRNRRIDLAERKGGAWTGEEARPFLVQEGDFLVSRGNGSLSLVGRGGLVAVTPDPVAYPDTLIRVRVQPSDYDVRFLSLVWDSTPVRRQIEGQARTTAGIYKVNQEMLRLIELPLLSLNEQSAMVERLDAAMSECERVRAEVHRSRVRSTTLRRSVLGAAFSGQLVPQDPDDEPASALLERIRAERAATIPTKRTRRAKAS